VPASSSGYCQQRNSTLIAVHRADSPCNNRSVVPQQAEVPPSCAHALPPADHTPLPWLPAQDSHVTVRRQTQSTAHTQRCSARTFCERCVCCIREQHARNALSRITHRDLVKADDPGRTRLWQIRVTLKPVHSHTTVRARAPFMIPRSCLASYSGCSVTIGRTAACSS
jgi:hypothetical protein